MKTKVRTAARKPARKKGWSKKFPVSVAQLTRWSGFALAFAAVTFLLLLSVQFGPSLIASLLQGMAALFGVGVFLPLTVVSVLGIYLALGQRLGQRANPKWNHVVGTAVLACLFFGMLASMRPSGVSIGGIELARVTAGGDFGRIILGPSDWSGLSRLVALLAVGFAFVAPSKSLALLVATSRSTMHVAGLAVASAREWQARRKRRLAAVQPLDLERMQSPADGRHDDEEDVVYEVPASALEAKMLPRQVTPPPVSETPTSEVLTDALPPLDLLEKAMPTDLGKIDLRQRVKLIEDKLAEYGVDAKVVEVNQGPAFTQFGIEPGWDVKVREIKDRDAEGRIKYDKDGKPSVTLEEIARTRVKVSRLTALANDLALALAAPTIRIEAPVPGKSMVGIEVPNVSASLVSLRAVIESSSFQRIKARSRLGLALGQGVEGGAVAADLTRMPHLLIAGATGSGKSVCINGIITSLLMHATPEEVRLLMIDPKRVELITYDGVPHLLCPVVVEMGKVVGVLRWVAREMDDRYKQFAEIGARNIQAYNEKMAKADKRGLPYLVVIIDELADLMMLAADEVERIICRLAQLARATGIHLVIATQRPSVDVVTGLIKANIPTRISFAVTSQVDSRTILDMAGAEKLLGRGDMLYMPTDAAKPLRLQGAFVSDAEIESIVAWWKAARPTHYVDELLKLPDWTGEGLEDEDPKLDEARRLAEQGTHLSASLLQRRLRVGYNRAKRIMERLEEDGLVDDSGEEEGFTRYST